MLVARMTRQRLAVIGELKRAGGAVRSKEGRAVALLHAKLGAGVSLKAMTNTLSSMEDHGLVEREIRGKRTYVIRLAKDAVPGDGMPGVQDSDVRQSDRAVPEGTQRQVDHVPSGTGAGDRAVLSSSGVDYRLLADALLARVAEVIDQETDKAELNHRLSGLLADRERFRRQVGDVGEELAAVKRERDGLRVRLKQAEENIEKMLDPRNKVGMGDRHKRALERFMQAKPIGR